MSLNQEEEEYIERLYREMYTRLCIYAMSALGSKALAEEAVQDTFRFAQRRDGAEKAGARAAGGA